LKFLGEVWARRAWAGANDVELTKMPKSGGRRKKNGGGKKNKMGLVHGRWATATLYAYVVSFFKKIGFFLDFLFGVMKNFLVFWKNGCTAPPFIEDIESSIPHGAWRFNFFSIFFPKIRRHLDLPIHYWDFSFMKKKNHQKFHKNC
jgi:hypothetical protein